mmetsp:Transcript_36889/g.91835  ORF Transcript_36889/g.91835 Transcript_36889/m.91835 type:complete len:231 (-) Transcript_36889:349-1041(-)
MREKMECTGEDVPWVGDVQVPSSDAVEDDIRHQKNAHFVGSDRFAQRREVGHEGKDVQPLRGPDARPANAAGGPLAWRRDANDEDGIHRCDAAGEPNHRDGQQRSSLCRASTCKQRLVAQASQRSSCDHEAEDDHEDVAHRERIACEWHGVWVKVLFSVPHRRAEQIRARRLAHCAEDGRWEGRDQLGGIDSRKSGECTPERSADPTGSDERVPALVPAQGNRARTVVGG